MDDRVLRSGEYMVHPDEFLCGEGLIVEGVSVTMAQLASQEWQDPVAKMLDEVVRLFQAPGTNIKGILSRLR